MSATNCNVTLQAILKLVVQSFNTWSSQKIGGGRLLWCCFYNQRRLEMASTVIEFDKTLQHRLHLLQVHGEQEPPTSLHRSLWNSKLERNI